MSRTEGSRGNEEGERAGGRGDATLGHDGGARFRGPSMR